MRSLEIETWPWEKKHEPPKCLETIEVLSTLSRNPNSIGLLYEVAKAELESLADQLAAQVAQCAELEEERVANQFVDDDSGKTESQAAELKKYRDMEQQLKSERRKHMDLGVRYFDMKKELIAAKKLLEAQDLEMAREEEVSRSVAESLGQKCKDLREAKDLLEKQSAEIEKDQQDYRDLQGKYQQQATELQEAKARIERPWVEYDQVKAELKQRENELKSAKAKVKTLESDVDASRTAIVELSSQLEGQLDELEELRKVKSEHEEQRRDLEQESCIHKEFATICDEQASEIVQLKIMLEGKDAQLEKQRKEYERKEQGHRLDVEDEDTLESGMEEKLANLKVELVAAKTQVEAHKVELQRAIAERDLLRINAESERTKKIDLLKKQYISATKNSSSRERGVAAAAPPPRFGLPGVRATRVGSINEIK
mmetsp:Transcript_22158/g.45904  ORF Transcript_22158/g.45904 Transcript_22158/m.45904 type:complete len:428 (-) Transcript_22158:2471-3754(-)